MRILFILLVLPACLVAQQPTKEFNMIFNRSRELLYYGKFTEAMPLLHKLDSLDSNNPNINYLLGVSYIASGNDVEKGLERLERSAPYVTNAYRSGQAAERGAPIYNWYYLGVGYSFIMQCDKAEQAFKKFKQFISDPNDSYVADADNKVKVCQNELKASAGKKVEIKPEETFLEALPDTISITELKVQPSEGTVKVMATSTAATTDVRSTMKTRTVLYTTRSPLYAVQVGAFDKLLPSNEFKGLKNIHSFIDRKGVVRYVVGHCVLRSQAENLRKAIIEAGYKDAFIVDVNSEEKFSEEVIHPVRAQGKKEYRVQLGVFRNEIPEELSKIFLRIDNIKETHEGDLTILTSGSFKDHDSAMIYRTEMLSKGVPGAFVVVFVNGKRQSLASAN